MDLMALDENFIPTGQTRLLYFDLSWHRKYYETGQFQVQILAADYLPSMKYIYTNERPELGMIQKIEYTDDDRMVVLSGFFFEKVLSDKIIYPMFEQYGTRAKYVYSAVQKYRADIPKLVMGFYEDAGEKIQKQDTGTDLETMSYETLKVDEKSYRISYDYETDRAVFEIYQGKDRTQDQMENNFVTFSKGFRNIRGVKATLDSSNYKNYFVVGGSGEGADRIYEIVDLSGGEYQRQLFIDAKNENFNSEEQTIEDYRAGLRQKAVEKALDYVSINNVEFDVAANAGAKYLEDYDLGDKCDIIIDAILASYQARIIEVLETWNQGVHKVTLVFGDKIPTQYEKARLR